VRTKPRDRLRLAALGAVAVLLLSATAIFVAGSTGTVTYTGCLNKTTGIPYNVAAAAQPLRACLGSDPVISWNNIGPQGATGPAGSQGPKGATGPTGPAGPAGATGAAGAVGPAGPAGATGAAGAVGPAGPAGPVSLAALAGTPCQINGETGTLEIDTDQVSGIVTITCVPPLHSPSITVGFSESPVFAGDTVHTSATLTGATSSASGTVTYNLWMSGSCAGSPAHSYPEPVTNGSVGNTPDGTYDAGTYAWQAVYGGDAHNSGATSACDTLTVVPK